MPSEAHFTSKRSASRTGTALIGRGKFKIVKRTVYVVKGKTKAEIGSRIIDPRGKFRKE
jgi:hypothetical protein